MRLADVLVALAAAVAIVALRPPWDNRAIEGRTGLVTRAGPPTCAEAHEGWRDQNGHERPWTAPLRLRSNGAVYACPPHAGTMRLELIGSPALGRHAHAVVVVAGVTVFDGQVETRESLALEVAARSPVLIAFVNDLYRSSEEDRDLWIGAVDFTTP